MSEFRLFSSDIKPNDNNLKPYSEDYDNLFKSISEINHSSPYAQSENILLQFFNQCLENSLNSNIIYTTHCIIIDEICQGFALTRIIYESMDLDFIAINTGQRRLGFATKLMTHILNFAQLHGCHEIILEVGEKNDAARSLYQKFGFTVTGKRNCYYKNQENAIIFTKQLL